MAKSNVYYSDTKFGTKLNVFEKGTKAGGKFYYVYLDVNQVDNSNISYLVLLMKGVINDLDIKTKKGKVAYQVSWSFPTNVNLNKQEEMFDKMFAWLSQIGYVDKYDSKKSKTSASTPPVSTSTQTSTEPIWKVGRKFIYESRSEVIWLITKIEKDDIYLKDLGKSLSKPFLWLSIKSATELYNEGKIEFVDDEPKQETTLPQQETTLPQIATKPKFTNNEIDALKRELADLLFLKENTSDLNFEEKIEISKEITKTQRKIDEINEKLFEESVTDNLFFDKLFEQSFTPLKNDRYLRDTEINTLNEFVSPSGDISDLNEGLQKIVNSKEFKDWFGDWRNAFFYRNFEDFGGLNISKVLSDKFEPLLVWHGTNNEFSFFDFENFPANYFAKNKEYSEFFATNKGGQGYVLPFFLNIKKPLDLTDFGNESVSTKDFFDWMYLNTGMTAEQLEVNPLFLDPNFRPVPVWMYIRNNPTMLKKIADSNVYDGIKFYEYNPNLDPDRVNGYNPNVSASQKPYYETLAYIVFDPHQVKLADANRGEIMLASLKSFMLKRGGKL